MAKDRDAQKSAVYTWERNWHAVPTLTLDECRALIAKVFHDYHPTSPVPPVVDGRGTRNARGASYHIGLPRWARQPVVVLHETTHALLTPEHTHGPVFASLFLDLLARYAGIDKAAARKVGIEQRPRRVHFAPASQVPQRKSREYMRWYAQLEAARHVYADARSALDRVRLERPTS